MFFLPLFSLFVVVWSWGTNQDATQCDSVFYPEGCFSDEIAFKRLFFRKNLRKETSIYLRGHSPESILIHTLVVFSDDVGHFHNSLVLNPRTLEKYDKILHYSEFQFNNEILAITKGREILFQFSVAPWISPFFNGSIHYDAVLLLDYYSALWNEYNTWIIERSRLILKKVEPPWPSEQQEDFRGLFHLWCDRTKSLKKCHVKLPSSLFINDHEYFGYGLVLDPGRSDNLLPQELMVRWQFHEEKEFLLVDENDKTILHINNQFQYELNTESDDIVLGVDFVHWFQKVEHNVEAGYYKLYFSHVYHTHDKFQLQAWIISIFIGTIIYGVIHFWMTSPNYNILQALLEKKPYFLFPLRLVSCEFLSIVIAIILWIMTLAFSEDVDHTTFHYSHSDHKRRRVLFLVFSVYHVVLNLVFLLWNWNLTKATFLYYYANAQYYRMSEEDRKSDPDYTDLVRMVNIEEAKIHPRYVIVRNILINTIAATNLLLILNYLSEHMRVYFIIMTLVSLIMVYYYTKMLIIGFLFMFIYANPSFKDLWRKYHNFVILFWINFIVYALFVAFSMPTTYYSLLNELNSMYSDVILWVFTTFLLLAVLTLPLYVVFYLELKFLRDPSSLAKLKGKWKEH